MFFMAYNGPIIVPCMKANYPYAIKKQRRASKVLDALAGSLWQKIAGVAAPRNSPRHGVNHPDYRKVLILNKSPPGGEFDNNYNNYGKTQFDYGF